MNKKQRAINESLKVLDKSFHYKENVLKINRHSRLKHELAKFLTLWELTHNNLTVISEAIFQNKKRADLFCLEWNKAIEIVNTETEESIEKKRNDYPVDVTFLKADDVLKQNGVLIKDGDNITS